MAQCVGPCGFATISSLDELDTLVLAGLDHAHHLGGEAAMLMGVGAELHVVIVIVYARDLDVASEAAYCAP